MKNARAMKYIFPGMVMPFILAACMGCSDMIADQQVPGRAAGTPAAVAVTSLAAAESSTAVTLTWTDPSESYDHIEVTWTPSGSTVQTVASGAESYTASGLTDGTAYTFTVRCVDVAGNVLGSTSVTATPFSPSTVAVTGLSASGSSGAITLTWTDPARSFDHIEVTWTPSGSTARVVAAGTGSYTASGLTNGTEYTFTVRCVDGDGNAMGSNSVTAKPGIWIYTAEEMDAVRNNLSGYYILMADISLSGYASGSGWTPIGTLLDQFTGTFDGNGHTIAGLTINISSVYGTGLFGFIETGSLIKDLKLTGVSITNSYTGITSYVGGLVGCSHGNISNCHAAGTVTGTGSIAIVGGLVGQNAGAVTISYSSFGGTVISANVAGGLVGAQSGAAPSILNCYSTAAVTATTTAGGLAGQNSTGTIRNSFATGAVEAGTYSGGLAGRLGSTVTSSSGTRIISNCYATGTVTAHNSTSYAGGLLGYYDGTNSGTVEKSYAAGTITGNSRGGIVGEATAYLAVDDCFYDSHTTGYTSGWDAHGTPKTTIEMQTEGTFTDAGWDFTSVWTIDSGYPYLRNTGP